VGILVFLIVFLIISSALRNAPQLDKQAVAQAAKVCPPHKWEYKNVEGVERLKCGICSMLPGEATYQPRGLGK